MWPPMRRRLPFIALVVVAAWLSVHCTASPAPDAGRTSATGVVETSAPASPEPSPVPTPTGPPITPALAKAQNFLLYLGGNLNTHAVTRIEGQDTDAARPRAVMNGAPTNPVFGIQAPELSPDRTKVVYVEGPPDTVQTTAQGELIVQSVDGTGATVLATGANGSPAWSPDGTKLAVGSGNPSRLAIVDLAAATFAYVGPGGVQQDNPAWSPDGKHLVYFQAGGNGLVIANVDGSAARQLTTCIHPACIRDLEPAWSPDGLVIAFTRFTPASAKEGAEQIYSVRATGGAPIQLTSGLEEHASPSW